MSPRHLRLPEAWRSGALVWILTTLVVVLAYRTPAVLTLDLGTAFPSGLHVTGFYDAEGAFRWSRAESEIRFRDVGAATSVRVELELSGFRPPGSPPPMVLIEAGRTRERLELGRRFDTHAVGTETRGVVGSDLVVRLRSETFSPGGGDDRALGVRVARARVFLERGAAAPSRQVMFALLLVFLLRRRLRARARPAATGGLLLLIGAGYAWMRVYACLVIPGLAIALAGWAIVELVAPNTYRWLALAGRQSLQACRESVRYAARGRGVVLAGMAAVLVPVSYCATPTLVVDLGSGAASPIARRFGPLDRDGSVTFRRALAGATLDLRDFGASDSWEIAVTASLAEGSARGTWVSAGEDELRGELGSDWTRRELVTRRANWGVRSGFVLDFPGMGPGTQLLVDRVEIDRGRTLPALRPWLLVVVSALLMSAACLSITAGLAVLLAILGAVAFAPIVTVPLLPTMALGAAAALTLGTVARGVGRALAAYGLAPPLPNPAVVVALMGFLTAFCAMVSPLYVGGHYAFHTNIAQEISRGEFLTYFLPYPGSMLSRQPQWNNVVVPHSCLFHTVVSPAALLPAAAFHLAAKLWLAALGLGITLGAATIATALRGRTAGIGAAIGAACLPVGYQLLGLGHLMTLFGTWAATLSLGFLVLHAEELSKSTYLRVALGLTTLCFLAYTGALLFASLTILAATVLSPSGSSLRRGGLRILLLGWLAAFLLYYVHWTLPFLRDSMPVLLGGSGGESNIDLAARIGALPGKLAYTFGSAWLPVLGFMGLFAAVGDGRRRLLIAWAAILPAFSVLDLYFNFLLKHHYFTYPAIAVGLGMGLAWALQRGWAGRVVAGAVILALLGLGLSEALAVASGNY